MDYWYIAVRRCAGGDLKKVMDWYAKGSHPMSRVPCKEIVTLDDTLCRTLLDVDRFTDEDWRFSVDRDWMRRFFVDRDYLQERLAGFPEPRNDLAVVYSPRGEVCSYSPPDGFRFLGYDILDMEAATSLLLNWMPPRGVSPINVAEYGVCGLIENYSNAREVMRSLQREFPEDHHASGCQVWAVFISAATRSGMHCRRTDSGGLD